MNNVTTERGGETAPHLSVSQISMYLRCSLQYWFRYIQGIKAPPNLKLTVGKAGHEGLEFENRQKVVHRLARLEG